MAKPGPKVLPFAPRVIRWKHAPDYVGFNKNDFNKLIRPYLTEIPIMKQGIGFDRLELDAWVDQYKARYGRPAKMGGNPWDAKECQGSEKGQVSGISTSKSKVTDDWQRAVKQATSTKPKRMRRSA